MPPMVHVASVRGGPYTAAVAFGWAICPFAVQTVMHPTDAIWLQLKLQGLPVPQFFTAQQAASGFVMAVFALCVLVLMQMVCTVLFYRRAKMEGSSVATPALWPLAAAWGLIADAVWWYATGVFDPSGGIVGLSSAALTVGGEMLCNKLGREFVFGPAQSAQPAPCCISSPEMEHEMGFLSKGYWQRRVSLTGPESIKTLEGMERFFRDGKNWTQGAYHRPDGTKCLVGAAQSVHVMPVEDARYWLLQAVAERGFTSIESFNDSRASYSEIAEILARAKQLAAAHSQQGPAPAAQNLPPRPALAYQPEERVEVITMADMERVAVKQPK